MSAFLVNGGFITFGKDFAIHVCGHVMNIFKTYLDDHVGVFTEPLNCVLKIENDQAWSIEL